MAGFGTKRLPVARDDVAPPMGRMCVYCCPSPVEVWHISNWHLEKPRFLSLIEL